MGLRADRDYGPTGTTGYRPTWTNIRADGGYGGYRPTGATGRRGLWADGPTGRRGLDLLGDEGYRPMGTKGRRGLRADRGYGATGRRGHGPTGAIYGPTGATG